MVTMYTTSVAKMTCDVCVCVCAAVSAVCASSMLLLYKALGQQMLEVKTCSQACEVVPCMSACVLISESEH